MHAARNTTFSGDDIYYYAHYVAHGVVTEPRYGIDYFFAPHNGHLQVGGKLVYQLLFDLAGSNYAVFRAANTAGLLACVLLFFTLANRRVGPVLGLAASILLLFLGYAWEPLIWAFDLHTVYALALGLAALALLERNERRWDPLVCLLLVLSMSMIELGLAFVVGVAVSILLRPDRRSRLWIVLIPIALYTAWWVWARQFHQSSINLLNVHLIPIDFVNALGAIAGSLTGLNPTGQGAPPQVTTVTPAGVVLAGLAVIGLGLRVRRGGVPPTLWVFTAVLLSYWTTIALGGRQPDSSRYILAGSFLVLLIGFDALRGMRWRPGAVVALCVLIGLAIPPNVAKFYDGRRLQLNDAAASGSEYAMETLAYRYLDPDYVPSVDPKVYELGGGVNTQLPAKEYFRAAAENGPLAYSLDQVREQPLLFRQVADATLIGALGLKLSRTTEARPRNECVDIGQATPGNLAYFPLPVSGVEMKPLSPFPTEVTMARFAKDGSGVVVGRLRPGEGGTLKVPPDAARERWRVYVSRPVEACAAAPGATG